MASARLGAIAVLVGGLLFFPGPWLLVPALLFLVLLAWHQRLATAWELARRASSHYREGLLRLQGEWTGRGPDGSLFANAQHPYARDLDLFGKGSLYQLLCRASTRAGQERLAQWLQTPASPDQVESRQAAAQELRERLDLREQLAGLQAGQQSLKGPSPAEWGVLPLELRSQLLRGLAALLGILGWLALAYWVVRHDPTPLGLVILVQQVFLRVWGRAVDPVLRRTDPVRAQCLALTGYLRRLEQETVEAPLLRSCWAPLQDRPSQALGQLEGFLDTLESRRNPLLAPFFALSLAPYQLACSIENWRSQHGQRLGRWLESLAEIEGLLCLASYAWENPDYAWPQMGATGSGLTAVQLGHPLLGPECVCNDVGLSEVKLWIVSGSNMSGKSSLLRALGCNVVLAMAGGPVRAQSMRLEPLRVAASIQLGDSLMAGISRFYAEILRLRQVLEQTEGEGRLLYLLDEILGGTNSQDRLVGARAVVRRLFELNALGLVTTHDLALTELVTELGEGAANVHFEDQLEEGVMSFDYQLRTGVIGRSNALQLMRAVGLQV